jgi:enamine deaminase RidA (YjgF/YER057c/UK114 family)
MPRRTKTRGSPRWAAASVPTTSIVTQTPTSDWLVEIEVIAAG